MSETPINQEAKITRAQIVDAVRNMWILNGINGVEEHLASINSFLDLMMDVFTEADKQKFISCFSETTNVQEAFTNYLLSMGAVNVNWS